MSNKEALIKKYCQPIHYRNGFTLPESIIAVAVGSLIIIGSSIAIRSTQTLLSQSTAKATLRQNSINGLRLLRSEIERSAYIVTNGQQDHTELSMNDITYQDARARCNALSSNQLLSTGNQEENNSLQNISQTEEEIKDIADTYSGFVPVFGLKMLGLRDVVLYGLSGNGNSYSLMRCGVPLNEDGTYSETVEGEESKVFIDPIIQGIQSMPCYKDFKLENDDKCNIPTKEVDGEEENLSKDEILKVIFDNSLDNDQTSKGFEVEENTLSGKYYTPIRSFKQPAFRFETDRERKLIRFIDPSCHPSSEAEPNDGCLGNSMISALNGDRELSSQTLELTAFARADKRSTFSRLGDSPIQGSLVNTNTDGPTVVEGTFFGRVASENIRFLLDGSGSMSACMSWKRTNRGNIMYGWNERIFHTPIGDPLRIYGSSYRRTTAKCIETRMEAMQRDLITILTNLDDDTMISIEAFSSSSYLNNKEWLHSSGGRLVRLGDHRNDAIAFVGSLNDGNPLEWGGTDPWDGIDRAFEYDGAMENEKLFFLSDGEPNKTMNGIDWSVSLHNSDSIGKEYVALNEQRSYPLTVNTSSLGLESPWMNYLSRLTDGVYRKINANSN